MVMAGNNAAQNQHQKIFTTIQQKQKL